MPHINDIYRARINMVIDHVNTHLDQSFKLDELAAIANFSSFHFHRIFVAVVGESLNFYTNRVRLEKGAKLIKYSKQSMSEIAYASGFSSPATFSRSFKNKIENSKICKELFPLSEYLVPMSLKEKARQFPVVIKEFPRRKIAYIRVVNSYTEGVVAEAFTELIFNMHSKIREMYIPKAQYASTVVSGDIKIVATATNYLFDNWLLNSEYEPAHMHGIEIFLDKDNINNWEHFDLELCIPIVPLKKIE